MPAATCVIFRTVTPPPMCMLPGEVHISPQESPSCPCTGSASCHQYTLCCTSILLVLVNFLMCMLPRERLFFGFWKATPVHSGISCEGKRPQACGLKIMSCTVLLCRGLKQLVRQRADSHRTAHRNMSASDSERQGMSSICKRA